jgi:myo-inositol-1(or 4)-monophosphatase
MERRDIDEYMQFAVSAAEAAGPIALRYFRRRVQVSDKATGGFFDPVTAADREVEAALRAAIEQRYPGHGIIGEEDGVKAGVGALGWVIDPIDGTRAFITGMPAWGIMLGLVEDGEPRLGVVHQPFLGETFCGDRRRAWLRADGESVSMHARETRDISDAALYCTHPSMFSGAEARAFDRAAAACRLMRYGGDCYAYCLLALGEIDMIVENGLQSYDILPLIPILEGAGAVVTDWEGRPPLHGGRVAVAATPELHTALLEVLGG